MRAETGCDVGKVRPRKVVKGNTRQNEVSRNKWSHIHGWQIREKSGASEGLDLT
jgi:hypothetical protein